MILSKRKYLEIICVIIFCYSGFSQNNNKIHDSIHTVNLKEVLVKGESKVMSLSKKLFSVDVIQKREIQQLAANNLADMLNYNLNVSIVPDPSTGKSTISMFGLDGQYVKILLDGIPITGDTRLGSNIDITQISLDDVERVEIVEGAMGVLYGDNAVAGVINIVTKRSVANDWRITASLQEETVGNEFAFFNRGKHIQNIKVATSKIDNLNLILGLSRRDFAGYFNNYQGKDYANIQDGFLKEDGLRGMEWNPKTSITSYLNASYNLKNHHFFYKFQYYNGDLDIYNHNIISRIESDGTLIARAKDRKYNTNRFVNNLNVYGPIFKQSNYEISVSYQTQKRYFKQYIYNILQKGIEKYLVDRLDQSNEVWYSKGSISNLIPKNKFINAIVGYEINGQKGFDAIATGFASKDVVENTLNNYDLFSSLDFNITEALSIHPGIRYTNNSQFGNRLIWQLASSYQFNNGLTIKANVGSAFRPPNFGELFFYFVDSNHNVRGNPNLKPEYGFTSQLHLDKIFLIGKGALKSSFRFNYIDLDDKISSVVLPDQDGRDLFTSDNVGNQKKISFSINNALNYRNIRCKLGVNYLGSSSKLYKSTNENTDFLWGVDLNSNISYTLPSIHTTASIHLKYSGVKEQILSQSVDSELVIGEIEAYALLDASIRTELAKNLDVTLGVRNLTDIKRLKQTNRKGNHGESINASTLFGYGRSYFLTLLYKINLN